MDKHELFERLAKLTLKLEGSNIEESPKGESLALLAENFRKIEEISDDEAWIVIDFLDRNPIEITDGYWGDFFDLIRDLAPGWPYGNDLLLRIPVGIGGLTDIKSESLTLFNDSITVNTAGLPLDFRRAGLNLEDYWEDINWKALSESEFRFILIIISYRGKKALDTLKYNSDISSAIDKFKLLNNYEKNEKIGLRWLSEAK